MTVVSEGNHIVRAASKYAELLLNSVPPSQVGHREAIMVSLMAYEMIRATYPDKAELFEIAQEAEALLDLVSGPVGEC